jgi:hypothetical protein
MRQAAIAAINIFIEGRPGEISDVLIENSEVHGLSGVTSYDGTGIAAPT